jgi:hypothetical protein
VGAFRQEPRDAGPRISDPRGLKRRCILSSEQPDVERATSGVPGRSQLD